VSKVKGQHLVITKNQPLMRYSQSPFISHPPEEQVLLPCCTVAFEYVLYVPRSSGAALTDSNADC